MERTFRRRMTKPPPDVNRGRLGDAPDPAGYSSRQAMVRMLPPYFEMLCAIASEE
jgi:hypothetical protein